MPILDTELESPQAIEAADPSIDEATKPDPRAALERVFAALGRPLTAGTGTHTATPALPSARARAAIEEFAQCATIEDLNAKRVNLKALAKDLFDWHLPDGQTRATGNVVKAMGRALLATDEHGTSRFPQAVEMLGFASACAPLLQPDRLARLIDEAPKVTNAYAPDRYTLRFHRELASVLTVRNPNGKVEGRWPDQRRETLLTTLWHAAHNGRFWDVTMGIATFHNADQDPAAGAPDAAAAAAAADAAAAAAVREVLDGHPSATPEGQHKIITALVEGRIPFSGRAAELVAGLQPTASHRDELRAIAEKVRSGEPVHPDTVLLMSVVPWATPSERPESPVYWLVRQLSCALKPDPDTGVVLLESLPDKPRSWADLYPKVDQIGDDFPFHPAVRALDGRTLENHAGVRIEVVKNAMELAANAQYMGNCTASYRTSMERGTYVLFRLIENGAVYNASLREPYGNRGRNVWEIGEVNSRHNGGGVPPHVRAVATTLTRVLPPPVPVNGAGEPEETRDPRRLRGYRVTD